jgi:hypothetical protein
VAIRAAAACGDRHSARRAFGPTAPSPVPPRTGAEQGGAAGLRERPAIAVSATETPLYSVKGQSSFSGTFLQKSRPESARFAPFLSGSIHKHVARRTPEIVGRARPGGPLSPAAARTLPRARR